MEKSKIQRKNCVCNIFFSLIAVSLSIVAGYSSKSQPLTDISPFFQSSAGRTQPTLLLYPANPALLANIDNWGVSASYSPSPFGIANLGFADLAVARRMSDQWVAGMGISGSGSSLYHEFCGSLLSAATIGEAMQIGTAVEYTRISVQTYGMQQSVRLHVGATFQIDSAINAAVSIGNILRAGYGISPIVRQEARFGIGIIASAFWTFDADIRIVEAPSIEIASMYSPIADVKIRIGYSTLRQAVELFPAIAVSGGLQIFSRLQWSNKLGLSQQLGLFWTPEMK